MQKLILSTLFLLLSSGLSAAESNKNYYSSKTIPETLLHNANSVIRLHQQKFEIVNKQKTIFTVHKIVTILNDEGSGNSHLRVYYDELQKIKSLNAVVYDKQGNKIADYKEKDFLDISTTSSGTLYDDNRLLYKDLTQKDYPYTIELSYEIVNDNLYFIPDYYLLYSYETSVEESSYQIVFPEELRPRYKTYNTNEGDLIEAVDGSSVLFTWSYSNIKAVKEEPFSVALSSLNPIVLFSPAKYSYEGYEGDFSTWDGMADFQEQLNKNLDGLTDETKEEIKSLTVGLTPLEKVKTVYAYMQKRTRYISIQLGIGGFQPFSAENTDKMGYGDCKALSYYTQMLLKEVGVTAYYTWIYGGSNPPVINKDFPNINFNHVILFVPLEKDSIWLECTNQKVPAGYLGDFTGNRFGLVIDGSKAKLIKTKSYNEVHNTVVYEARVKLSKEGYALVSQNVKFSGIGSNYYGAIGLHQKKASDQEKWLRSFISLPDFKIITFDISTAWSPEPEVLVDYEYEIRNALKNYGNQLMFLPNMIDPISVTLKSDDDRQSPIAFGSNRKYEIMVEYEAPDGYTFVEDVDSSSISSQFGEYSFKMSVKSDLATYRRVFNPKEDVFPKEDYEQLRNFYKEIRLQEKKRIKLVKTGS